MKRRSGTSGTMKAALCREYGPPENVRIETVGRPVPRDDEIRIQTHATTVSSADWRARTLEAPKGFALPVRLFFGPVRPRQPILGTELSGVVESVGKDVTRFQVGDEVFAFTGARMGCHAEYRCVGEDRLVAAKPPRLDHHEAAALSFGGTTALDFLRRGDLQAGERVLINGASGSVGTAMVQIAKHQGAHVTGVCSTANVDLVRSLGADAVVDYKQEDFTRNQETYDVIADTAGTAPYNRSKGSLSENGRLLLVLAGLPAVLQAPWVSMTTRKKVIAGPVAERPEDLRRLAELAESGAYTPVIDRRYRFGQIAEAHRYVETGRKKGNVVVAVRETSG